jgi:hypothetical protein
MAAITSARVGVGCQRSRAVGGRDLTAIAQPEQREVRLCRSGQIVPCSAPTTAIRRSLATCQTLTTVPTRATRTLAMST